MRRSSDTSDIRVASVALVTDGSALGYTTTAPSRLEKPGVAGLATVSGCSVLTRNRESRNKHGKLWWRKVFGLGKPGLFDSPW